MVSKKLSKILLVIYLLLLIWILLFKFSLSFSDIAARIAHPTRSVNLIPFQGSAVVDGKIVLNEIILNGIIFIPLGVLLGISAKNLPFIKKSMFIFTFSLTIEVLQFLLGIGVTDVTDLLMNFSGGFLGLCVYHGLTRVIPETKVDKGLIIIGMVMGIFYLGMILRMFFFPH
ncbi:VanZ family protein [Enterococcus dongliensis]|uniref:VanZ family protein n=1 Tax=Enterococcus dongliensis TaxID=2559925 RepID=UPI00288F3709|nr:VanZ family protein [Enterococcus dongliensis]MDT2672856.1 VanZ family protein [Enterococcus dongliensis]